jgi:hypothetical protein
MTNRYGFIGSLVVLIATVFMLIPFSAHSGAESLSACAAPSGDWPFHSMEASTGLENQSISEFDDSAGLLAQGLKCSDLKPGTCNMGSCEKGWKCISNDLLKNASLSSGLPLKPVSFHFFEQALAGDAEE